MHKSKLCDLIVQNSSGKPSKINHNRQCLFTVLQIQGSCNFTITHVFRNINEPDPSLSTCIEYILYVYSYDYDLDYKSLL